MKTLKQTLSFILQFLAVAGVFALLYMLLILGYGAGMPM